MTDDQTLALITAICLAGLLASPRKQPYTEWLFGLVLLYEIVRLAI